MSHEGVVEQRNERGIKVGGEWLNLSKFNVIHELPEVGDTVHAEVDAKGFLKTWWKLLDEEPADGASDERTIRLAVLQAAATFAASRTDIKSKDVLAIADSWLQWLALAESS